MPRVLGLTVEEAENAEGVSGVFEIREVGTEYSDYAEGLICRQSPEEGETRKGGGLIIEVWTSAGEAEGTMQNIVGMTLQQAQSQMRDMIEEYDLSFEAPEEDRIYSDEYGKDEIVNISIECEDCNEVLFSLDAPGYGADGDGAEDETGDYEYDAPEPEEPQED